MSTENWGKEHDNKRPKYDYDYNFDNLLEDAAAFAWLLAWLDTLFHHTNTTSGTHGTKVVIFVRCTGSTGPTKLVIAIAARHVVATGVLFDPCLAHRAQRYIIFVFICPPCQLVFKGLFTTDVLSMPNVFALIANFCRTLVASHFLGFSALSSHVISALRLGAPAHQRICIQGFLSFKPFKLFNHIWPVAIDKDRLNLLL